MSWKPINASEARRAKFLAVLPELPPISCAPDSIMKVKGWDAQTPQARNDFEANFWRDEVNKFYKAIDGAGIIWKMRNPAAIRHTRTYAPGEPVDYGDREKLGHIDDFRAGREATLDDDSRSF